MLKKDEKMSNESSSDYSEPVFKVQQTSIFSWLSCIIFMIAGVFWIISSKHTSTNIIAGIILIGIGGGLIVLNYLKGKGQSPNMLNEFMLQDNENENNEKK